MAPVDANNLQKKYRERFMTAVTTPKNKNLVKKGLGDVKNPISEKETAERLKAEKERFRNEIKKRPNFSEIDYDEGYWD